MPHAPVRTHGMFDAFLYAVVLEEGSGASLSVLSLLARLDLDPWEVAETYARTPGKATVAEFAVLLSAVLPPGTEVDDSRVMARGLLALLPSSGSLEAGAQQTAPPLLERLVQQLKKAGRWISSDR
jgi:hypothetical protein